MATGLTVCFRRELIVLGGMLVAENLYSPLGLVHPRLVDPSALSLADPRLSKLPLLVQLSIYSQKFRGICTQRMLRPNIQKYPNQIGFQRPISIFVQASISYLECKLGFSDDN